MSKNAKIVLAVVAVVVLLGGLAVGIFLSSQEQDISSEAAPATTLKISPSTQTKFPGQTVTFTVVVNTGDNLATGVDINLRYDPLVVEVETVIKGSGISSFDQITKDNVDPVEGTISYSAFTSNALAAVGGTSLEILSVTGRVLDDARSGNYDIIFSGTTTVSGVEDGEDILIGQTKGTLSILAAAGKGDDASPTSSASATPTSSASATPTSSASATPEVLIDAGVSFPSLFSAGLGILTIVGSLLLLF